MKRFTTLCAIGMLITSCGFLGIKSSETVPPSDTINSKTDRGEQSKEIATENNGDLSIIYTKALTEYLKGVDEKYKSQFDTLYIGEGMDSLKLNFPPVISNCQIRRLYFTEATNVVNPKVAYVNFVGWVDSLNAEFIIVTFKNGGKPQHNCKMNFNYDSNKKEFTLNSFRFEEPYSKKK